MFAPTALQAAIDDFRGGVRLSPLWWRLGIEETVARYRRTALGPFWLASGTIAGAIGITIVFGAILGGTWREFFPFILSGITAWVLVAGTVSDGSSTFLAASGQMQIQRLPLSFYVLRQMHRLLINFTHQVAGFWMVTLVLGLFDIPHWHLLFSLPLILLFGFFISFPVGMLATRYRDLGYMVVFIMQALFMLTPIFWRRAQIPEGLRWFVDLNPFAYLLELIRQPFMGNPAPLLAWLVGLGLLAFAAVLALFSLMAFRRRVVFWL